MAERSPETCKLHRLLAEFQEQLGQRAAVIGFGELNIRILVQQGRPKMIDFHEKQSVKLDAD